MGPILVGYDGSEPSQRAVLLAGEIAGRLQARAIVLVVAEFAPGGYSLAAPGMVDPIPPSLDPTAYERLAEEGASLARGAGGTAEARWEWGNPADRIVAVAEEEKARTIVVGHGSTGAVEAFFLGSVARSIIDRAHCSVLVVR